MPKLDTCKIGFEFEFGVIQDRHMTLQILHDDNVFMVAGSEGKANLEFDIVLPTRIVLKFSGKNPNTDTLVDSTGNIIEDMYVKITKVNFDGFDLSDMFLHKKIVLDTNDGQQIVTSYIGFNGTINFEFNESTVFKQYLSCNY